MKYIFTIFGTLLLLTSIISGAVYLNGVKVEGSLKGQTIRECSIEFKENGDYYITAKNYQLAKSNDSKKEIPEEKAVAQKKVYYAIFSTLSGSLSVPVTIFIDGKQVKREVPTTGQISVKLDSLKKGQHQINVVIEPNKTIGECSIAIGVGKAVKDTLEISVTTTKKDNFGIKGTNIAHPFNVE